MKLSGYLNLISRLAARAYTEDDLGIVRMIIEEHPEYTVSQIAEEFNELTDKSIVLPTLRRLIQRHNLPYQKKVRGHTEEDVETIRMIIEDYPELTLNQIAEEFSTLTGRPMFRHNVSKIIKEHNLPYEFKKEHIRYTDEDLDTVRKIIEDYPELTQHEVAETFHYLTGRPISRQTISGWVGKFNLPYISKQEGQLFYTPERVAQIREIIEGHQDRTLTDIAAMVRHAIPGSFVNSTYLGYLMRKHNIAHPGQRKEMWTISSSLRKLAHTLRLFR